MLAAIDAAKPTRTRSAASSRCASSGARPGLGSHTEPRLRLDARLAPRRSAIQAMKGVEIGDGFANAALRGSQVHDELCYDDECGYWRETNRAGGIEGGMSNGEPIVVRIAMKPLPTLMRRCDGHASTRTSPPTALVERSDTTAIAAAAVVGRGRRGLRARALRAREVRRRLRRRRARRTPRVPRAHPVARR